jgi:hypothetical protein
MAMACELTAWMAMLALDGPAHAWEPKRLRLRLFSAAGRTRLTTQNRLYDQERTNPRARGTPPTRRDSRAARHGQKLKTATRCSLSQTHQGHETLR